MSTTEADAPRGDVNELVPGLYIGRAPAHGRHPVDVIVLAAEEYQPHASRFPGVKLIRVPLDDAPWRPMQPDEIAGAVKTGEAVARHLRAGRSMLVTCAMGLNRSELVAGLAMHAVYGMGADEIVSWLRRARGSCALSNPSFEKLLRVVVDVKREA